MIDQPLTPSSETLSYDNRRDINSPKKSETRVKVSSATLHSNRGLHWWVIFLNFNSFFELVFNSLFESLSIDNVTLKTRFVVRNLQEGRYNPTALHLNLVLSLTPSQKFILICFWYLENLKIIFIIPELFFWNSC